MWSSSCLWYNILWNYVMWTKSDSQSLVRWVHQSCVQRSDLPPVSDWTNVLMLFIGLVYSQSSRLVDGPLGLMGNSIIPCGSGLSAARGQSYPTIDWLSPPGPIWWEPPSSVSFVYEILILAAVSSEMTRFSLMGRECMGMLEKGFVGVCQLKGCRM